MSSLARIALAALLGCASTQIGCKKETREAPPKDEQPLGKPDGEQLAEGAAEPVVPACTVEVGTAVPAALMERHATELDTKPKSKKCRSAQRRLREAREAIGRHDFLAAEAAARTAVEECATPLGHLLRAEALAALDSKHRAIASLEAFSAGAEAAEKAQAREVIAALRSRRVLKAGTPLRAADDPDLATLCAAFAANPQQHSALALATALHDAKRPEDAQIMFQRALFMASGPSHDPIQVRIVLPMAPPARGDAGRGESAADQVRLLRFSADGTSLAVATERNVYAWNLREGGAPAHFEAGGQIVDLDFADPEKTLLVSAKGKPVTQWNPADGKHAALFEHADREATSTAVSPDGGMVAVALAPKRGGDSEIVLWSSTESKRLGSFKALGQAESLAFYKHGTHLIWEGPGFIFDHPAAPDDDSAPIEVSDQHGLYTTRTGIVCASSLDSESTFRNEDGPGDPPPDISWTETFECWDPSDKTASWTHELEDEGSMSGVFADNASVVAAVREKRVLMSRAGETPKKRIAFDSEPVALALRPNGKLLASATRDGMVRLHTAPRGRYVATLFARTDGRWAVVTTDEVDGPADDDALAPLLRWTVGNFEAPGIARLTQARTARLLPTALRRARVD